MVYLDHAATTPLRPEALAAMLPFLTEHFGNPSGSHATARRAKAAIEDARDELAAALGCDAGEIVFTGSGTEADNLAVTGTIARRGGTALCSAIEHHAVLAPVEVAHGAAVPVHRDGTLDLDALEEAIAATAGVSVVSVMLANNEVGVVQPMAAIIDIVRRRAPGTAVHTDAVQAFPWIDVATVAAPCDLVSVSAHKFGGPKGVGALVVRRGTALSPVVLGGGQERELRSGTHNVAGIVGMAAAATATVAAREETVARVEVLRDRLADQIVSAVGGVRETVPRTSRIAGNCHLIVDEVESESLLVFLDDAGVCASAGSACASGAIEPSHVLTAMGFDRDEAGGALRLSLGSTTTDTDVDLAAKAVVDAVTRLRGR